jgi:hypothetical protein
MKAISRKKLEVHKIIEHIGTCIQLVFLGFTNL